MELELMSQYSVIPMHYIPGPNKTHDTLITTHNDITATATEKDNERTLSVYNA